MTGNRGASPGRGARGDRADVVVVGAGVMGGAAAFYLAGRGQRVILLEQGRVGGAPGASGASGSMLQALSGEGGPLEQLGQESRAMMPELARELYELSGTDIGLTQPGTIVLAFSEDEVEGIKRRRVTSYGRLGEPHEWLPPADVLRLEPGVSPEVLAGLYLPQSHNVYAPQYVKALAHGAGARGAELREGVVATGITRAGDRVTGVETTEGPIGCEALVLATGAWTGQVSRWLDTPLPVGPQRGQIMALQSTPSLGRVRHILHAHGGYIIPKANGTAVVGATRESVGFDARLTAGGLHWLTSVAERTVPFLAGATFKHAWYGFRPLMRDGAQPVVGRLPGLRNAYVASGHGAIGVTVSPATGQLLAALIAGDETAAERLAPFDPARYS
ncbi:MAG TPA: FAD-dependent oxidoreductase [Chloroflexota bacterium]|nr:FAD-dependent oxidoreductase [Chloroflexota bacterium]